MKNLKNLGVLLSKKEQKQIHGGDAVTLLGISCADIGVTCGSGLVCNVVTGECITPGGGGGGGGGGICPENVGQNCDSPV